MILENIRPADIEEFEGSLGWRAAVEFLQVRLESIRNEGEGLSDPIEIYRGQGKIAEIRSLISLPGAMKVALASVMPNIIEEDGDVEGARETRTGE